MDSLDKLRQLTNDLPSIPKLGDFKLEHEKFTEYIMPIGTCISRSLLSQKEISVAKTFISSGGEFPKHNHPEKEYIVMFSGSMIVYYGDERKTMQTGDCIVFERGVPHRVRALEDVWLISVTIPYSKDYPDA